MGHFYKLLVKRDYYLKGGISMLEFVLNWTPWGILRMINVVDLGLFMLIILIVWEYTG